MFYLLIVKSSCVNFEYKNSQNSINNPVVNIMTLRVSIKNPADAISRRLRERDIPTLKKTLFFSNG